MCVREPVFHLFVFFFHLLNSSFSPHRRGCGFGKDAQPQVRIHLDMKLSFMSNTSGNEWFASDSDRKHSQMAIQWLAASLVQVRSTLEFSTRPYRNIRNMLSRRGLTVLGLACPSGAMTHANQRTMASADDAACALQKALGKPKIWDNYLYFHKGKDGKDKAQSVQLSEISSNCTDCVTDGQPYELGCQGLAPWIIRSGKLFQGWFRFTQCPGFVYLDGAAMIRAQLSGFRHSVCDHR